MMKKLLVVMLVFGMASLANAGVIDVVTVGLGDMGHAGTSNDPLWLSETIPIQIVLNNNPYPDFPDYDGYFTDAFGLDLHVTGGGSLSAGFVATSKTGDVYDILHHADLDVWAQSDPLIVGNSIAKMAGGVLSGGIQGEAVLIWNLFVQCDGPDDVILDLTLQDVDSHYSDFMQPGTPDGPYPDATGWKALLESNLGDLTIYQVPEPATIALLGLGSLFLMRRRRK